MRMSGGSAHLPAIEWRVARVGTRNSGSWDACSACGFVPERARSKRESNLERRSARLGPAREDGKATTGRDSGVESLLPGTLRSG